MTLILILIAIVALWFLIELISTLASKRQARTRWTAGNDIKFPPDYQRPTGKQRERCRRKVENAFSLRDDPTRKDNHRL